MLTRCNKERRITPRQKAFAEAYCSNGFNAAAAARSVGYSSKVARQVGHRLVRERPVHEFIQQALSERGLTRERVLDELAAVAYANLGTLEPLISGRMTLAEAQTAGLPVTAIKRFQAKRRRTADGVEFDDIVLELHPKTESLDKLAKVLGLYDDRPNVNVFSVEEFWGDLAILQRCIETGEDPPEDVLRRIEKG